jgi:hypothetical protein
VEVKSNRAYRNDEISRWGEDGGSVQESAQFRGSQEYLVLQEDGEQSRRVKCEGRLLAAERTARSARERSGGKIDDGRNAKCRGNKMDGGGARTSRGCCL